MPIDDALEELEEIPEHILKETPIIYKVPENLEEFKKMYKDKFKINLDPDDDEWVIIRSLKKDYKDLENNDGFKLEYSFCIDKPKGTSLKKYFRCICLYNKKNDLHQICYKNNFDFEDYMFKDDTFTSVETQLALET
mgnify:CR=1 FL=1|jgi:hypothetical protein